VLAAAAAGLFAAGFALASVPALRRAALAAALRPPEDMVAIPGGEATLGVGLETPPDGTKAAHLLRKKLQDLVIEVDPLPEPVLAWPPHAVRVPPFRLDRHEATNAEYARFVRYVRETGDHSRCPPLEPPGTDHRPRFLHDPRRSNPDQPVVGVTWYDAAAYAAWRGARLPTEEEMEAAARGPGDGRFDGPEAGAGADVCPPAGGDPADLAPTGVLGLAGGAREWTSTPFFLFEGNPAAGIPDLGAFATVRGGCYRAPAAARRTWARAPVRRAAFAPDLGFRCAR